MKLLKIKNKHRYPDDVKRILSVLIAHGYQATEEQAISLWDEYSDSMAAGWMMLPDEDKDIYSCIEDYIEN